MHSMDDYLLTNRDNWDDRAAVHAGSDFYGIAQLLADPTALSGVVAFDRPRLCPPGPGGIPGDLGGLDVIHLQCHIGTDTLSLHRLGAASTTGLDFSPAALAQARDLADAAGAQIRFVEATVDRAVDVLGAACVDLVYTGIGALCWLPSIRDWASTVAGLLRPGGRLFLREGHPGLWSLADLPDDPAPDTPLTLGYPYWEQLDPTRWEEDGSYVQTDDCFTHNVTYEWNHGLGEIVTALLDQGLRLTQLVEHDSVPWEALPGLMSRAADGEWRLRAHPERLPLTYTLQAIAP